jgi:hypothetical protein
LQLELSRIDRQSFEQTAYFVFALAANSADPWVARFRVWFAANDGDDALLAEFRYWTVPTDDAHHVYEIPLRALEDGSRPVPYEAVATMLFAFGVDGI